MEYLQIIAGVVFVAIVIVAAVASVSKNVRTHTGPAAKPKRYNKYGERVGLTPEEFAELRDQTQRDRSSREKLGDKHTTDTHIEKGHSCGEQLIESAFHGDMRKIRLLLDEGLDVNETTTDGVTALRMASQEGHTEVVKLLLDRGADVNAKDASGVTALLMASHKGHTEIVKVLIDKGADVNVVNVKSTGTGSTALIIQSCDGHTEVVRLLLEKGADVNATGDGKTTALIIASLKGHKDIVELLIDHGADINAKSCDGTTALYMAARFGRLDIVDVLLLNGAETDAKRKDGETPLCTAAEGGYTDIVRLLIAKDADVNAKTDTGRTAIFAAAWLGHTETVGFLIENGAELDAKCDDGETALSTAARGGYTCTVRLLLDKGANPKATECRLSAINEANLRGYRDIVQLLEAAGEKPTLSLREMSIASMPSKVSNAQPERQELDRPLAFADCNKCGSRNWVKPDGTDLVNADFEESGYIRYGVGLVCGSCGNKAVLKQDCLLNVDVEGKVRRPKPQSIALSPDLPFHVPTWLSSLAPEDEIGVLFDLSALSAKYGEACWEIVFRAVRPEQLAGCSLLCGDVSVRVGNLPYAFCIALGISRIFRSDTEPLTDFVEALSRSSEVGLAPLDERFIYGSIRQTFPIIPCLTITPKSVLCTDDRMFGWILLLADRMGWARLDNGRDNR